MKSTIVFSIIGAVAVSIFIIGCYAKAGKEPSWKSYSVEKTLSSFENWAKRWPYVDNVTLGNRLRSAQLWVDIQTLKVLRDKHTDNNCDTSGKNTKSDSTNNSDESKSWADDW